MRDPRPTVTLLLAIASGACAAADSPEPRRATSQPPPVTQAEEEPAVEATPEHPDLAGPGRAFKGYELYSWQDARGEWRYALLPGTNRLKYAGEITSAALTEADLRQRLAELPAVETVTWCPPPGMETDPPFAMPPDDVVAALTALATEREVHLRTCD